MGRLDGHILPGTFFIGFALWWTWCALHRYFICKRISSNYDKGLADPDFHFQIREKGVPVTYMNTASFVCPPDGLGCSKFHLEGFIKVFATTVGFIGELATAFRDGAFVNLGNGQHMAMYFFFGVNGLMDILKFHKLDLIPDMDYLSAILALMVEAFLFFNHLHGRSPMDIQLHTFLLYVILATIIAGFCELCNRKSVMPLLVRIYFTMLQGTWFYQVGFILYPPNGNHWDETSHSQMMITTLLFTVHCAVILIFMMMASAIIFLRVKRLPLQAAYQELLPYDSLATLDAFRKMRNTNLSRQRLEEVDDDTDSEL